MDTNDIRPAAIGVAAAVLAFAGIVAWVEIDPLDTAMDAIARRKLTPQERAELARIAAEDAEAHARYVEGQEARRDRLARKFHPELLREPGSVERAEDLSLDDLVAEYAHAQELYRRTPWVNDGAGDHRDALFGEVDRRRGLRFHTRQPRTERLRVDIAYDRMRQMRDEVIAIPKRTRPVPAADTADDGIYPEFSGPAAADYGTDL